MNVSILSPVNQYQHMCHVWPGVIWSAPPSANQEQALAPADQSEMRTGILTLDATTDHCPAVVSSDHHHLPVTKATIKALDTLKIIRFWLHSDTFIERAWPFGSHKFCNLQISLLTLTSNLGLPTWYLHQTTNIFQKNIDNIILDDSLLMRAKGINTLFEG